MRTVSEVKLEARRRSSFAQHVRNLCAKPPSSNSIGGERSHDVEAGRGAISKKSRFKHNSETTSNLSKLRITYSDRGGILRVLSLTMSADKAGVWSKGLNALLRLVPDSASPAHERWVLSCMAATSARGATGRLHRSELRSLLRRANASARISNVLIEEALESVEESEQQMELPQWLTVARLKHERAQQLLDTRQVAGLLLRMCTSSKRITELFNTFASNGQIGIAEWRNFVRSEQVSMVDGNLSDNEEAEVAKAQEVLARVGSMRAELHNDQAMLTELQFQLLILDKRNEASAPPDHFISKDVRDAQAPKRTTVFDAFLSHNWGMDDLGRSNHARAVKVKQMLEAAGLRCWLDVPTRILEFAFPLALRLANIYIPANAWQEEQMQGDINSKMTQGIDDSAVIVVFVTNQYIKKVAGDGAAGADDNCKMEFDYAVCITRGKPWDLSLVRVRVSCVRLICAIPAVDSCCARA
jgi:hypothetical protein